MFQEIDKLREITRCCQAGLPLNDGHANWLHQGLDRFLRHECSSIDDALGLKFSRGGVPWWLEEAIRERDLALREVARRFYADVSVTAQARAIHALAVRYAASAWRLDQVRDDLPTHYRGAVKEYLWRAFRSRTPMPVSERHLRNIVRCRSPRGRRPCKCGLFKLGPRHGSPENSVFQGQEGKCDHVERA